MKFHGAFGIGMLGIPWLYPTEINSLPMRTKGAALATATDWITNFAIVEITPIGIQSIGWKFCKSSATKRSIFLVLTKSRDCLDRDKRLFPTHHLLLLSRNRSVP